MKAKPTKKTIIITIVFFLGLVNSILGILGEPTLAITEGDITTAVNSVDQAINAGWLLVSAILAWWNNMSFTQKAVRADAAKAAGVFDTPLPGEE